MGDRAVRRRALSDELIVAEYAESRALSTAEVVGTEDVSDPADTRRWVTSCLPPAPVGSRVPGGRPHVDTW